MLKKSVIHHSGQFWKLAAVVIALLVGSFAPLFSSTGISWVSGTIIAIVGYAFGMIAIRCSSCSSMWFWDAALDAGLYRPLFTQASCPKCEHQYDT